MSKDQYILPPTSPEFNLYSLILDLRFWASSLLKFPKSLLFLCSATRYLLLISLFSLFVDFKSGSTCVCLKQNSLKVLVAFNVSIRCFGNSVLFDC